MSKLSPEFHSTFSTFAISHGSPLEKQFSGILVRNFIHFAFWIIPRLLTPQRKLQLVGSLADNTRPFCWWIFLIIVAETVALYKGSTERTKI